jgi:hypothetical protein
MSAIETTKSSNEYRNVALTELRETANETGV